MDRFPQGPAEDRGQPGRRHFRCGHDTGRPL